MEKYRIVVSEPWDFSSEDGENLIIGKIIKYVNAHCIFFKSDHLLNFGKVSGNILRLTPRFKGDNFLDLNKKNYVNGGLFNQQELSSSCMCDSDENFTFVLIGSIEAV